MADQFTNNEPGVKPVEHVLTSIENLQPALDFIKNHQPNPNTPEWSPTPDSKVFRHNDYWVVRQTRSSPEVRNETDLYIRDDAKQVYVLWTELDNNPNNATQLTSAIIEGPDNKMICIDGERKLTNSNTTLNYLNTLLTYSF